MYATISDFSLKYNRDYIIYTYRQYIIETIIYCLLRE